MPTGIIAYEHVWNRIKDEIETLCRLSSIETLLNNLTAENFDSFSDQIIDIVSGSDHEKEENGHTLVEVIRLVFEKAAYSDDATCSETYARLCRKMMERIGTKVREDGIRNSMAGRLAGAQLFRKHFLNRCEADLERRWAAKEITAKVNDHIAARAASNDEEDPLRSDESYAAQNAKRQYLALVRFIEQLFTSQILTNSIMHECLRRLLANVENPEEDELECLCKLLTIMIRQQSDTPVHMAFYIKRMNALCDCPMITSRMQSMLRVWLSRVY